MSAGFELLPVYELVEQLLQANSDLTAEVDTRMGEQPGDATWATPYVTWTFVSGVDTMGVGNERWWADIVVQVTAWVEGNDLARLTRLAGYIDASLHNASGAVSSGDVLELRRESIVFPPAEVEPGQVVYRQGGGEYRAYAQS